MPRYRITWKIGNYAERSEIIEADTHEQAETIAYKAVVEVANNMISVKATLLDDEEA